MKSKLELHYVLVGREKEKGVPLAHIDIGFLTGNISETTADTFDRCHCEHYLLFPINVRVLHTKYVLKFFICNQRLHPKTKITNNSKDQTHTYICIYISYHGYGFESDSAVRLLRLLLKRYRTTKTLTLVE